MEIVVGPYGMQSPWPHRRPPVEMYRDLAEQAQAAERLGFDGIALTEHSFWYDGYCPSLLPVIGMLSQVTDRLKLMTGAYLLPQHDPLQVAEEAAVCDRLSGGRLVLGFGAGYRPEEFLGHGVPEGRWGARFIEALEVVELALSQETFSYEGEFYTYRDVSIPTRPLREPPPIWVCAGYSDWMVKAAGRRGWSYCTTGGVSANDFSIFDKYEASAAKHGVDASRLRRGLFRDVMVMPSENEALALADEDYWPAMNDQFIGFGFLKTVFTNADGSPVTELPPEFKKYYLQNPRNPVGTPASVRQQLQPVLDGDFDLLLVRNHWANFKPDRALRCMETFAHEVMPAFRDAARQREQRLAREASEGSQAAGSGAEVMA